MNPEALSFLHIAGRSGGLDMTRLKACAYCGRVHPADTNCGKRPIRKKESTERTKLRTCRRWDKTRKAVNKRDRFVCRICLAKRRITVDGLETHHIIPIAEEPCKAYDLDNLITLCVRHHKAADAGKIDRDTLFALAKEYP